MHKFIVCTPHSAGRGGGLSLLPNFQKVGGGGGLTRPQLGEGVAGKEGGNFFQEGSCNFYKKIK